MDGIEVAEDRAEGSARVINVDHPFFVGGLSPDMAAKAAGNLEVNNIKFLLSC